MAMLCSPRFRRARDHAPGRGRRMVLTSGRYLRSGATVLLAAVLAVVTIAAADAQSARPPAKQPANPPAATPLPPAASPAPAAGAAAAAGTAGPLPYQRDPLPHRDRLSAFQLCRGGRGARRLQCRSGAADLR